MARSTRSRKKSARTVQATNTPVTRSRKKTSSKKVSVPKKIFRCTEKENNEICGRKYTKSSNLKNHILTFHKGLCWVCPHCEKSQVSLHSHIRHIGNVHGIDITKHEAVRNQFQSKGTWRLTEKAKDALIKDLMNTVAQQQRTIFALKNQLLEARKKLINEDVAAEESENEEEVFPKKEDDTEEQSGSEEEDNDGEESENDSEGDGISVEEEQSGLEEEENDEDQSFEDHMELKDVSSDEEEPARGPVFRRLNNTQEQDNDWLKQTTQHIQENFVQFMQKRGEQNP